MFFKLTEEQEIKLEAERAKAKAALRITRRVLKLIGLFILLAFAYGAGEMAGVQACLTTRESNDGR